MKQFKPTAQQQKAIDETASMIITACPGSGKTTVLTEKIRQTTLGLSSHKGVIAISFTRKASAELKRKCTSNAHDTKASFFGTIDSFCLKEVILPFLPRLWGNPNHKQRIIKKLASPYNDYLNKDYKSPTETDITNDPGFKTLYDDGILWMNSFAALALFVLKHSLAAKRYICARYSSVYIDEYQDSSPAQHQLFIELLQLGLTATAVGDSWQSIYEFRGGDSKLLLSLTKDQRFKHFVIDKNHRCHPSIVNYAERLIDSNAQLIKHAPDDIRVYRSYLQGNLTNIGKGISTYIENLLKDGKIKHLSDVAVLARKEQSLEMFVSGMTINYRLYNDNPIDKSSSSECAELYSAMLSYRYGAVPTMQELIDTCFESVDLKHVSTKELRTMILKLKDDQPVKELIDNFQRLAALVDINDTKVTDTALMQKINEASFLKQFRAKDNNEVQVMTLHKSKGLEFKYVFHLDLEEWSLPHLTPGKKYGEYTFTNLKQDTNLHYVGITRAEEYCFLIRAEYRQNAKGKDSHSNPSYFWSLPQLEGLYI
ncbi:ATP-dependent helicase [Vibrio harveyi]|uniref:UvrD-helicase domain-containing protein n=1 Tax=Vibrio harveyi TaxID=669 RepID=UPI001EFD3E98|nr:ATP-dependent helicase [Vibrio harveyi]MCG9235851.1 ATP-dependent helicase [Vibrio harveyi]MCG9586090.1 ATP-dependent helicase [Vibrio harveyi]